MGWVAITQCAIPSRAEREEGSIVLTFILYYDGCVYQHISNSLKIIILSPC